MTSQEFVIWLKGFTEGVHQFNITPKQWDLLKEKLSEVKEKEPSIGVPIGPGIGVPNLAPIQPVMPSYPFYTDPYNPFKVTSDDQYPGVLVADRVKYAAGTGTSGEAITTSGFIQRADQPVGNVTYTVTTGSGVGYGTVHTTGGPNVYTTSTAYSPMSGSWHFTNSNDKTLLND